MRKQKRTTPKRGTIETGKLDTNPDEENDLKTSYNQNLKEKYSSCTASIRISRRVKTGVTFTFSSMLFADERKEKARSLLELQTPPRLIISPFALISLGQTHCLAVPHSRQFSPG